MGNRMECSVIRLSDSCRSSYLITPSAPGPSPSPGFNLTQVFCRRVSPIWLTSSLLDLTSNQGHRTVQHSFSQSQGSLLESILHGSCSKHSLLFCLLSNGCPLSPTHSQEKEGKSSLPYSPKLHSSSPSPVLPTFVNSVVNSLFGAPCLGGIQEETPDLHALLPGLRLGVEWQLSLPSFHMIQNIEGKTSQGFCCNPANMLS